MKKSIRLLVLFILSFSFKISAQDFDSAKVYPLCFNSTFYIRVNREYIKSFTDTVFCLKAIDADSLYVMFQNRIKSDYIKTLPRLKTSIDIRLSIDFYKGGRAASNISVTTGKLFTIDNRMYSYEKKNLKQLDVFIPDLSQRLCIH